jgi:adenylate cyclase
MIFRGWALAELGNPEEGIKQIQSGREVCEAAGGALIRPFFLILLAEAYWRGNRMQEGLTALAEASATIEKKGECAYESEVRRLRAEFLLREGEGHEAVAERLLRSALMSARLRNAKSLELRATSSLARLLAKQNRRQEAREILEEIYNWFTEGFDTLALKEARSLLDELGAHSGRRTRTSNTLSG